ncbi:hypothetical protein HOM50_04935 [bacterium]|nr:hypothetical protein [bacterium]MBT5015726.1 hypothetical protein [bacterium]
MKKYIVLVLLATVLTGLGRIVRRSPDAHYRLHHPTIENLTSVFMDAVNAKNHTKHRKFITSMMHDEKALESEMAQEFADALLRLVALHEERALAQQEPVTQIKETQVIEYVESEIEGAEKAKLIQHINIAKNALRSKSFTPEDLIFALAAVGYLTGLLESPQTKQLVDMDINELAAVEQKIVAQIESSTDLLDELKYIKEDDAQPVYKSKKKDSVSYQDQTIITREGDRICTKKIKRSHN